MPKNEPLSTKQVAELLGVSPATVARMVKRKVLKARPVSAHLMRAKAFEFDRSEVERYITANS